LDFHQSSHVRQTVADAGKFDENIFATLRPRRFLISRPMNNESDNLRESLWRRKLSAAERAELRAQPDLELEARLTAALGKIPAAPVASNFTARVLAAIELEEKLATRPAHGWNWRLLFPRLAVAAAVLVFAGVSIQRYETSSQRTQLAKNLATVASAQSPGMDALENLDAIRGMSQSARADGELLAALQ
jgi:hypothetical protein